MPIKLPAAQKITQRNNYQMLPIAGKILFSFCSINVLCKTFLVLKGNYLQPITIQKIP